jgi:hypothetical protein
MTAESIFLAEFIENKVIYQWNNFFGSIFVEFP